MLLQGATPRRDRLNDRSGGDDARSRSELTYSAVDASGLSGCPFALRGG